MEHFGIESICQEDDQFKRTEGWIDNVEQKFLSTISFRNRKEKAEMQTLKQGNSIQSKDKRQEHLGGLLQKRTIIRR